MTNRYFNTSGFISETYFSMDVRDTGENIIMNNDIFPKKTNTQHEITIPEICEKWNIRILSDATDCLFYEVIMPDNLRKEQSQHRMWTKIIDDNDKVKGEIYFNPYYYIRKSFLNIYNI